MPVNVPVNVPVNALVNVPVKLLVWETCVPVKLSVLCLLVAWVRAY